MMNRRQFLGTLTSAAASRPALARDGGWRAGAAVADITPEGPLWMAGFAARKQAAQGTALPLHAKALALEGGRRRVVLVTFDLLGVTARMTDAIAADVRRRYGVRRPDILFNASHTHCGPVVDDQLSVAYDLSSEQWDAIHAYTRGLGPVVVDLVGRALARLQPATVAYARGRAEFAANRRVDFTPNGPVDDTVPVLRLSASDGRLLAIVFGYACHNTTLQAGFTRYHGDYAGIAQAALEARHPGVVAMFVAGCGADANPKPRGTLALVEQHGRTLAEAVERAIQSPAPLPSSIRTAYGVIDLPFAPLPDRAEWSRRLQDADPYVRRHARLMLDRLDREGRLPRVQPDPVQVWRFGRDLALVALGGEVVVDYALRLDREYPRERIWAAGYSNDVFGYVPSLRVLREGGYEGGGAMIYYGRPAPFAPDVEELIHAEIRRLLHHAGLHRLRPSRS